MIAPAESAAWWTWVSMLEVKVSRLMFAFFAVW